MNVGKYFIRIILIIIILIMNNKNKTMLLQLIEITFESLENVDDEYL